jgi:hypothetical protein
MFVCVVFRLIRLLKIARGEGVQIRVAYEGNIFLFMRKALRET